MKLRRIITIILVACLAMTLSSCGFEKKDELAEKIKAGETLEIPEAGTEVPVDTDQNSKQTWEPLDKLKTYNIGYRLDVDDVFEINKQTINEDNTKTGCMYVQNVDSLEVHSGNSTMENAFRNKVFIEKWNSNDIQNILLELTKKVYTDIAENSQYYKNAAVNAYFNLMSRSEKDKAYQGDLVLTREQFYTMMYKATHGYDESILEKSNGSTVKDNYYTPFVREAEQFAWLTSENGDLNERNISQPITKIEAIYYIINQHFNDQLDITTVSDGESVLGQQSIGNLGDTIGSNTESASKASKLNELAYMIIKDSNKLDVEIIRALKIASENGVTNQISIDPFGYMTKNETIKLLINTFISKNTLYGYSTETERSVIN